MKWLVIGLMFTNLSFGATPELLKCLGREEKAYHLKKDTGPGYNLNQALISEIIQIPHAKIEESSLKAICGARGAESWKLLQLSLIKGKALFVIPQDLGGMQRQMTEGMIGDYEDATRDILLNLISQIQALAPTPDCLTTELPQLNDFFLDLKYIQEEVPIEKIFQGRDEKIFATLRSYPKAIKNCQERLKKKLKLESKKARQKS